VSDAQNFKNPFPGLRPYNKDERTLFFGRNEPASELIRRLGASRFLAVVGVSGSGKSSLVKCGVLPALHGGFLSSAGARWRVATSTPGNDPIGNLARALSDAGITSLGESGIAGPAQATFIETVLRRGALGAVEAVRYARLEGDESVLVVIDQFEQLFRFESSMVAERPADEAAAFVKLLLEAASSDAGIYVMLTMRSDFLGECTRFRNLPCAINSGLYLIPRLTRSQLRQTIEGPVAVATGKKDMIAPRLVQRLLNDVGDDPLQLPILQHALMRTWDEWAETGDPSEPIDLRQYDEIGRMAHAMEQHALEVMDDPSLRTEDRQTLTRLIFQALTELGENGRVTRRPSTRDTLCRVANASADDVDAVIEAFRRPGRAFLMPPAGKELAGTTPIDISHESLITIWRDLKGWVLEEGRWAREYRQLARQVVESRPLTTIQRAWLAARKRASRLSGLPLDTALEWRNGANPTGPWAERYGGDFETTMRFLDQSETIATWYRRIRRGAFATVLVLLTGLTVVATVARDRAERARIMALAASRPDPLEGALILAELQGKNDVRARGAAVALRIARRSVPSAVWTDTLQGPITSAAFDDGAQRVLVVRRDLGEARIVDVETGAELAVMAPEGVVRAAAFVRVEMPGGESAPPRIAIFSTDEWLRTMALDGTDRDSIATPSLSSSANFVTFSRDGTHVAAGTADSIRLWNTTDHGPPISLSRGSGAGDWQAGAFSADGSRFGAWRAENTANVMSVWTLDWEMAQASEALELSHRGDSVQTPGLEISGFRFDRTGDRLVTAAWDSLRVWDIDRGVVAWGAGSEAPARWAAFDADGTRVVAASRDGTARRWEAATGERLAVFDEHYGTVRDVVFSEDGARALTAYADSTSRVWDTETGRTLQSLEGYGASLGPRSRFSLDGTRIVTADSSGELRIWPADGTRWFQTLEGHRGKVDAVAVNPDGSLLATAGADSTVRLWDPEDGGPAGEPLRHDDRVAAVAFSGSSILAAAAGPRVWVWDLGRGDTLFTVSHDEDVTSVAFSPDGRWLLTGSTDETAKLWDLRTRPGTEDGGDRPAATLEHDGEVYAVAFAPDGRIITGSEDWIGVWNEAGELLFEEDGVIEGDVTSLVAGPDDLLITGSGRSAVIWELGEGEATLVHTLQAGSNIRGIAIGSDTLVFTSEAGQGADPARITTWDLRTGDLLYVLGTHPDAVSDVAVTPDYTRVVTASADGTARLWPLDWKGLVEGLRDRATRACLTVRQRQQVLGESAQEARQERDACQNRYQALDLEADR